jgi:hypothetical protein
MKNSLRAKKFSSGKPALDLRNSGEAAENFKLWKEKYSLRFSWQCSSTQLEMKA